MSVVGSHTKGRVMTDNVHEFPSEIPSDWLRSLQKVERAKDMIWHALTPLERLKWLQRVDAETEQLTRIKAGGM
jgi:hypothetical protein